MEELETLRLKLKAARRLIRDLEQAAAAAEKALERQRIAETEAERDESESQSSRITVAA